MSKMSLRCASVLVVLFLGCSFVAGQSAPSSPQISPEVIVIGDRIVQDEWPVMLDIVSAPTNLKQLEPGQCVRFGVTATGEGREALVSSGKVTFEVEFEGKKQSLAAAKPGAVKQLKDSPNPTVLAASQAKWCVPATAKNGTTTIKGSVNAGGKSVALQPRNIEVKTFESAREQTAFADLAALMPWMQHFHAAPDPAQLLPALRLVAGDDDARLAPSNWAFFIEALKLEPLAAQELIGKLPGEDPQVKSLGIPLLKAAGYDTTKLTAAMSEEERSRLRDITLPDASDVKPGKTQIVRMDMLWARYFVTGRIEPIRLLVTVLGWREDFDGFIKNRPYYMKPIRMDETTMRALAYAAAGKSLSTLSKNDALLADYVEAIRSAKDTPETIKAELGGMHTNTAFTRTWK